MLVLKFINPNLTADTKFFRNPIGSLSIKERVFFPLFITDIIMFTGAFITFKIDTKIISGIFCMMLPANSFILSIRGDMIWATLFTAPIGSFRSFKVNELTAFLKTDLT